MKYWTNPEYKALVIDHTPRIFENWIEPFISFEQIISFITLNKLKSFIVHFIIFHRNFLTGFTLQLVTWKSETNRGQINRFTLVGRSKTSLVSCKDSRKIPGYVEQKQKPHPLGLVSTIPTFETSKIYQNQSSVRVQN